MNEPSQKYQATDERRRAIASAACALIVEKGFEGLRTRAIAEKVGINIATLHYHVPTKEALIELVAESMKNAFMEEHEHEPHAGLPPREQLKREIRQHFEMRRTNSERLLVMEELGRRARLDPAVARHINPMRTYWRHQIANILAAGIADGTFRNDLDPYAGATMVIGTLIAGSMFNLDDEAAVTKELFRSILSSKSAG